MLHFTAPIELVAGKQKRLSILAYSGDLMTVNGFGPVVVDLAGLAVPASVPILTDHDNRVGAVVAAGAPRVERGQLVVLATIADSDAARAVVSLLASGVQLQASIGAEPLKRVYVREGDTIRANGREIKSPPGGMQYIERAALKEISVTPIGADSGTSVALAAKNQGEKMEPLSDPVAAAVASERERVASIKKAHHSARDLPPALRARADDLQQQAMNEEIDLPTFQASMIELLRASRTFEPFTPPTRPGGGTTPAHLTAAIMVRAGYAKAAETAFGAKVMEESRPFHSKSLLDLCGVALQIDGRPMPQASKLEIIQASSTGSMPVALGDAANKILAMAYQQAPASWRSFCDVRSTPNFKTNHSVRGTFFGDLEPLGSAGEIKHQSYGEETYEWSVDTYAKQITFNRKTIINDDASVLSEVIPSLARAAARKLSSLVITTLLANGGSFYSSGNANYFEGAATNLQASSLATAIRMLRQMKDAEGNLLDLAPAVLLVPPELETTGRALLESMEVSRDVSSDDNLPTGNVFKGLAQLVVEPRLSDSSYSGNSATAWYLFSAPSNAALVVGFLDGMQTPTIESFDFKHDINTLTAGHRVYHDFGCALADHRVSIKSKGAA